MVLTRKIDWLFAGCVAVIAAYFVFLFLFTVGHGHFISDDFDHVNEAFTRSAWAMALTPIDVHLAPLHQLSSYGYFHAFGLNFNLAVALLLAALAGAGVVLFAGLRNIVGAPVAALTVSLILLSPAWVNVTMWWSAALHRIPFMLMCAACLYGYIGYRASGRWLHAAVFLGFLILAFGFYSKAILIPVAVVALEIVLCVKEGRIKWPMWRVLMPAFLMVAGAVVYYQAASSGVLRPDFGLSRLESIKIAALSSERFALSMFFIKFGVWAKHYWFAVLAVGVLALIWRRPKSALPLVLGAVLVFVSNLLLVKGRGPWVLFEASGRYLVDDLFLLAPFVALFVHQAEVGSRWSQGGRRAMAMASVAAYALLSAWVVGDRAPALYPNSLKAHVFMNNFVSELERLGGDGRSLYVEDAPFPPELYGFLGSKRDLSTVFGFVHANSVWVKPDTAAPPGEMVYRVSDQGLLLSKE